MLLEQLIGQPLAQKVLAAAIQEGTASHAYLFYGPDGTGKSVAALLFAREIVGAASGDAHPDIILVEPDGASLKIEQARKVQHELSLSPVSGSRRVAIIKRADRMTEQAANSLLKILEDPPASSVLILLAKNIYSLLPTVVSRCQAIPFRQAPPAVVEEFLVSSGVDPEKAKTAAALSGGIIGRGQELLMEEGAGRARLIARECAAALRALDPWALAAKFVEKSERPDRQLIQETLSYLSWILRDALIVAHDVPEQVIVNLDIPEVIAPLAECSESSLSGAIAEINRATRRIERNCHAQATLELCFLKIQALLAGG
jgi:DNA polymerase-3 subunit delta'